LQQFKLDSVYNFIIILHHVSSSTPFGTTGSFVPTQGVQRFGKNAAVDQETDIPNHTSKFAQYVADNVDHNIRTEGPDDHHV